MSSRARWCAAVVLALLVSPPARRALESSMSLHMLVQVPLLMACGFVLASGLTAAWRERLDRWNSHGIAGLLAVALATGLLMIPRLLDLAVALAWVDGAKALVLLVCGAALRVSWTRAGPLVQAFFLGNVLPMTAAVGQAYQDSPLRLCNAYLLEDQVMLGRALVMVAVSLAIAWLVRAMIVLMRRERAVIAQDESALTD